MTAPERSGNSKSIGCLLSLNIIWVGIISIAVLWLLIDVGRIDLRAWGFSLDTLEYRVNISEYDIASLRTKQSSLAIDIAYATSLAENADRYAHTHGFSDSRLKTDLVQAEVSSEELMQIDVVRFRWSDEAQISLPGLSPTIQYGVIAQDIEEVFPELVSTDEFGYKHVDYEQLSVLLLAAYQGQQEEINRLQLHLNRICSTDETQQLRLSCFKDSVACQCAMD